VAALGHEVIAREVDVRDVGAVTARERPDVALVGLGESSDHALELIEQIVQEAACPVIALIHSPDADFVREASKRGVFAYITDADALDWQSLRHAPRPVTGEQPEAGRRRDRRSRRPFASAEGALGLARLA
jgi:AmiR/NasT family two-component response regulator